MKYTSSPEEAGMAENGEKLPINAENSTKNPLFGVPMNIYEHSNKQNSIFIVLGCTTSVL